MSCSTCEGSARRRRRLPLGTSFPVSLIHYIEPQEPIFVRIGMGWFYRIDRRVTALRRFICRELTVNWIKHPNWRLPVRRREHFILGTFCRPCAGIICEPRRLFQSSGGSLPSMHRMTRADVIALFVAGLFHRHSRISCREVTSIISATYSVQKLGADVSSPPKPVLHVGRGGWHSHRLT
jgi:hypothetical protein